MYKVYAKKNNQTICIHNDEIMTKETALSSPKLELSEGNAGSFDFKLPPSNNGYSFIERLITEIIIKKLDVEIWSGRVLTIKEDFFKNKTITCEGELAYLNDTTQPQYEYSNKTLTEILTGILSNHNTKAQADKQFSIGVVTVTTESSYYYTNYESTIDSINNLVKNYGGFIRLRKVNGIRYIDYIREEDRVVSTQEIKFGRNLLDFTKSFDSTDFCTVVLPLGKSISSEYAGDTTISVYTTVESVNNGSKYVINQEAVNTYGWIEKIVNYNDIEDPEELLLMAQLYLSSVQFENLALECNAVDLGYLGETPDTLYLSEKVYVKSPPHGLDRAFPITKISIPLDNPSSTSYTMGTNIQQNLSTKSISGNSAIIEKINNTERSMNSSMYQLREDALNNAAELMDSYNTGYVTVTTSNNGSQELYISDRKISSGYDPSNPMANVDRYWRWNSAGLAYYSSANVTQSNPTGIVTAWNMNGEFNASVITTGTLNADRIKAGIISDLSGKFSLNMDTGALIMRDGTFTGSFSAQSGNTNFSATSSGISWIDTYSKKYLDGTMEMYDTDNPNLLRYKWDKTGFVSYGKNYSGSREFEVRYGFSGYFTTEEEITPVEPIPEVVEIESVGSGSSSEWISNAIAYYQNNQNVPFAIFGLTANSSTLKMINDGDIYLKSKNGNISIYTSVNDLYGTIEISAKDGAGRINLDGQVECWNGASGTLTDGYGTRWTFEKGILVNIDNPNNY